MKRKEKKKKIRIRNNWFHRKQPRYLKRRRISTQLVATRNQLPTIPWRIPKYLRNNTLLRHKFCKVLNPSLSLSFSPFQTGKEKNHRYSSPLSPPSLKRVVPKIAPSLFHIPSKARRRNDPRLDGKNTLRFRLYARLCDVHKAYPRVNRLYAVNNQESDDRGTRHAFDIGLNVSI